MMDQWTNAEDLLTGYQPPIEIIMGQVRMEQDKEIYRVVQSYGVNVDKEELLRALQYDRWQYEKGYADGLRHRESEIERLEKENAELLISGTTDILISDQTLFRVRTEHPIFKAIKLQVANEIFDAIDESMIRDHAAMVIRVDKFIELKKKFTEGNNNNAEN